MPSSDIFKDKFVRGGIMDSAALLRLASDFEDQGYAVLPAIVPDETIVMLGDECDRAIAPQDPDHRNPALSRDGRIFAYDCQRRQPALRPFLFGDLAAAICRALLGGDAYFFLDQFVVKEPLGGGAFTWHQDSGYVVGYGGPPDHRPFVSLWIPLDDITVASGALLVQPGSHRRGLLAHVHSAETDEFGIETGDPGVLVEVARGDVVVFSSLLVHATGRNVTAAPRRAYLAQYTAEVMIDPGTRHLRRNAIPLLRGGKRATMA